MEIDKLIISLKECLNSEDFKEVKDFLYKEDQRQKRYIYKLKNLTLQQRNEFIQKCIDKYESYEYYNKEYKLGYEPRTPLYDIIFDYAKEFGESLVCIEDFSVEKYQFDNWIVELYIGQGSFIKVYNKVLNKL